MLLESLQEAQGNGWCSQMYKTYEGNHHIGFRRDKVIYADKPGEEGRRESGPPEAMLDCTTPRTIPWKRGNGAYMPRDHSSACLVTAN